MSSSDIRAAGLALALLPACESALPGGELGATDTSADAGALAPRVLSGCLPFRSLPGIDTVAGALRSIPTPDGGVFLVVDDAVVGGTEIPGLALVAPSTATLGDCLGTARFARDTPTSALDPASLQPLSGVERSGSLVLYYVDPTDGAVGVATQDPADGRFHPGAALLWTADRPSYGTAAVIGAGDVYALGCATARFLDADCFVARAPSAAVDNPSAYAYYTGSARWSQRVDDAWPATSAGLAMDVAWLASENRWLMAYVAPLATTISVRSGLSPEGPWSAPLAAGACDLADQDMFCAGIHLHPTFAAPAGHVVLSYAAASLSPDVASRRASDPDKWWPRIVVLSLPALP